MKKLNFNKSTQPQGLIKNWVLLCFMLFIGNNNFASNQPTACTWTCNKGSTTTLTTSPTTNTTYPGDVIISAGVTINFNNLTVKMKANAKIIVNNTARLNLNNTTITSDCTNDLWGGIEVYGNQTNTNVGKVYLTNSKLEYAQVAIMNTNYTNYYSTSFYDGYIEACNTTFKDNGCDVYLYNNKTVCNFNSCTFTYNNLANSNLGCMFLTGLPQAAETNVVTKGGSVNINSSTFIVPNTSSARYGIKVMDCQANIIANKFTFALIDIWLMTSEANKSSTIKDNTSTDAGTVGILSYSTHGNMITNNKLTQTIGQMYSGFNRYGVMLKSSNSNSLTSNTFQGNFLQMTQFDQVGTANNNITKNIFSNVGSNINTGTGTNSPLFFNSWGNHQVYNSAQKAYEGLYFTCNTFSGNYHNILSSTGGIRYYQAGYNGTSITSAAGNNFPNIPTANPAINLNNIVSTTSSGAAAYRYYYNGAASTSNTMYPGKVTANVTRLSNSLNPCATNSKPKLATALAISVSPVAISPCKLQILKLPVSDVVVLKDIKAGLTTTLTNKQLDYTNNVNTMTAAQSNALMAEISVLKGEKDEITSDIILNMLLLNPATDSTAGDTLDKTELINQYMSYDNPYGDYQVANLQFSDKNYSAAFATLSAIPTKYSLTTEQSDHHADLVTYYNLLKLVYDDNRVIYQATTSEQNSLKSLADKPSGVAKYRACSWLEELGVHYCTLPVTELQENSNSSEYSSDIEITMYPMPFTTTLNIEFDIPTELTSATFSIYDYNGNEVYTTAVQTGQSNTSVGTSTWNTGVYLGALRDANGTIVYTNNAIK